MTDFNESDVIELAETVVAYALEFDHGDSSYWGWNCQFCSGHLSVNYRASAEKLVHALDCPIHTAKDILTRT